MILNKWFVVPLLGVLLAFGVLRTAQAQAPDDNNSASRLRIGPEIGVLFPTSGRTRDRFGTSWPSLGIGIGPVRPANPKGETAFSLNFFYQQHHDNHVFLAPLGVSYRQALGTGMGTVPYIGVSPALYLADIRSVQDNIGGGLRTGVGVSVFTGLTFGESGNIEIRYQAVSKIKSFDFSGLIVSAGYRF